MVVDPICACSTHTANFPVEFKSNYGFGDDTWTKRKGNG